MFSILQLRIRLMLGYALCLFCLVRPLWGWMDRKATPEAPALSTPQPAESVNVLGEWLATQRSETPAKSMSTEERAP